MNKGTIKKEINQDIKKYQDENRQNGVEIGENRQNQKSKVEQQI